MSETKLQPNGNESIVYNITVQPDQSVAEQWLQWQLLEQGPQVVATGCFTHFTVLRLLDVDEALGPTYAVQYHSNSIELYLRFVQEFEYLHSRGTTEKWGQQLVFFETIMQQVN